MYIKDLGQIKYEYGYKIMESIKGLYSSLNKSTRISKLKVSVTVKGDNWKDYYSEVIEDFENFSIDRIALVIQNSIKKFGSYRARCNEIIIKDLTEQEYTLDKEDGEVYIWDLPAKISRTIDKDKPGKYIVIDDNTNEWLEIEISKKALQSGWYHHKSAIDKSIEDKLMEIKKDDMQDYNNLIYEKREELETIFFKSSTDKMKFNFIPEKYTYKIDYEPKYYDDPYCGISQIVISIFKDFENYPIENFNDLKNILIEDFKIKENYLISNEINENTVSKHEIKRMNTFDKVKFFADSLREN